MEKNGAENYYQLFTRPVIRYGRLINLLAIPLCFIPSLVIWTVYGVVPDVKDILTGWGLIASIYGIFAIIEPVSYFPIVGLPGTYMVCLSGNIGNVRIPAAAVALDTVGAEPGSKKAELVSTLGISGSIITNAIVVTITAIGGAALMKLFPPVVLDAFGFVTPSIFGAIFLMNAKRNVVYGAFAFCLSLLMLVTHVIPTYLMVPVSVFGTIAFALKLYGNKK